jgi:Kef-type K+ transport system membrane component KefB
MVLTLTVPLVALFRYFRTPSILAYLAIGALVSPHQLELVPSHENLYKLADFGVVFLMFTIGLEFNLSRLMAIRQLVFGLGTAQVVLTMGATMLPSLAAPHGDLWLQLGLALGKAALVLLVIFVVGKRLMQPLFSLITHRHSTELFMLNVLWVVLGMAALTELSGLSLALGAFLGGMLVSSAEKKGQLVLFGDAGKREVLTAAGIARAVALVITHNDLGSASRTLNRVQLLRPDLPVIVRTTDELGVERMKKAGATEVVPEIEECSLMLAMQTLLLIGTPKERVDEAVGRVRQERYNRL